jgi:DNA-directed RNA polymerase subunit RPC12/RpoP
MVLKIAFAVAVALFMFRIGLAVLRMLATPIPEPPPAGELRKVKLQYRCSLCGTEVRMTVAPDETPDPPRHCMDDMELQQTEDL